MKMLDLFCGAGGCSVGYNQAGFDDITGVDINPMPNYPFKFIQVDAIEYLKECGHEYDFIHASPPCQRFSAMSKCRPGLSSKYPNLIPETREYLIKLHIPYVIENVAGARNELIAPVMLCGKYFNLKVYRHRYFEISPFILTPSHKPHRDSTPKAGHGISPKGYISVVGNGGVRGMTSKAIIEYWKYAMGIDWNISRHEIAESIPPAYTKYIGERIIHAQ